MRPAAAPYGIGPGTCEFLPEPDFRNRQSLTCFSESCVLVDRASVYRVLGPIAFALWGEMVADPDRNHWWEVMTTLDEYHARIEKNGVYTIQPGRSRGVWKYSVSKHSLARALLHLKRCGFVSQKRRFQFVKGRIVVTRKAYGITHSEALGATPERSIAIPAALRKTLSSLPSWRGHGGNRKITVEDGRFKGEVRVPAPCRNDTRTTDFKWRGGSSSGSNPPTVDRGVTVQVACPSSSNDLPSESVMDGHGDSSYEEWRASNRARSLLDSSKHGEDFLDTFKRIMEEGIPAPTRDPAIELPAEVVKLIPQEVAADTDRPQYRIPPPPRLSTTMTDAEAVGLLVVAFRAASHREFGKRCWAFSRGDITKAKQYPMLLAFAQAAKEHKIQPHKWAQWKIALFRKNNPAAAGAPVSVVFHPKSLTNNATLRWYFSAADWNDASGIHKVLPEARKLDALRRDMKKDLTARKAAGAATSDLIRRAKQYRESWNEMRERIRRDSAAAQMRIVSEIHGGGWVW